MALSADIKATFLQDAVPNDDSRCLLFLCREDSEQKREVLEYNRHVFGAKSLPTFANYALHQVTKDNAKDEENLVKAVQRNFYMDNFLKSVRTPQEAIDIYQKVREILSKFGLNLTKWITSDEEVKSQIPEADRSTKANVQGRATIILNPWTELECRRSLIVYCGTEQEGPAKNFRELSYPLSQQCSTHL